MFLNLSTLEHLEDNMIGNIQSCLSELYELWTYTEYGVTFLQMTEVKLRKSESLFLEMGKFILYNVFSGDMFLSHEYYTSHQTTGGLRFDLLTEQLGR